MKIEVLGGGCARCHNLYDTIKAAIEEKGIDAELLKDENYEKIIEYGITSTPAMVVDGRVMSSGKTLTQDDVAGILANL